MASAAAPDAARLDPPPAGDPAAMPEAARYERQDQPGTSFSADEVRRQAVQGRLPPQTQVRRLGTGEWQAAQVLIEAEIAPAAASGVGPRPPRPEPEKRFFMDQRPWLGLLIALLMFLLFGLLSLLRRS